MKLRGTEKSYQIFLVFMVVFIALLSAYPILYVVSLSLTSELEWIEKGGFVLWPANPTIQGYKMVISGTPVFLNSFVVSVLRTILGTSLNLGFALVTGYVLSRKELPGRRIMLFGVLFTILFSGGLIPTFLVVRDTRLLNTIWAMIIPQLLQGWFVLVFKQFFEQLPKELEESAVIDGTDEIRLMTRIIVPMSKPVMAALGLFMAVQHWNSWFDALVYIRSISLMPIQLILRNMFVSANFGFDMEMSNADSTMRISSISLRMAVTVIGTLPIMCVYPFLQKYFVKGVYMGAVKG